MNLRAAFMGANIGTFNIGGQDFQVDQKYVPIKNIGSGAYGVVCAATDNETKTKVAIKKIPNVFEDLVDAKRILREVRMLAHFNHPNVCSLHDLVPPQSLSEFKHMYLVLGLMETDLHKIIYSKNVLTNQHYQYFIYQLLKGLKYIHSAGVIHRDLKPSNILLNSNCDLQICDFGLARSVGDQNVMTQYVVTRWYRAPEIMCCDEHYDAKVDVWSVGCIMAEMIRNKPLFPGDHYIQQLNLIFKTIGTPNYDDTDFIENNRALQFIRNRPIMPRQDFTKVFTESTPDAIDMLEGMLQFNPLRRMNVNDCLDHSYLANYHNEQKEIECPELFDYTYETETTMTTERLKTLLYDEIVKFRSRTASEF